MNTLAKPALLALAMLSLAGCAQPMDDEAARAALRANDIADLNNLMSLHSWYHAAMRNGEEIEKIWAKRDDIVWAQNIGYWQGHESIMKYYGVEATPDVTEGGFVWHTITSGVVEVAGDRETAKGVWYTPGIGGKYNADGSGNGGWMWEKYGVDFIREDGEWKIWHMKVYTDFSVPVGEPLGAPGGMGGPPPPPQDMPRENAGETIGSELAEQQPFGMGQPDYVYKNQYRGWAPGVSPQLVPRPPEPYGTWSETWSYIDEGE